MFLYIEMKKRFRDLIDDILYEDLLKIKKDLESGGIHIRRLINDKITKIEKDEIKVCATCGNTINPYFMDDYVLRFGRHDFKKRAFFCGLDCLKYFLLQLESKQKRLAKQES